MAMFGALPLSAAYTDISPDQTKIGLTTADLMPQSQPPVPKPSFFGQGGAGRAIVGNIADGILQSMGQQPVYRQAVQRQRDLQDKQQTLQQTLAGQLALWQAEQKYKADNPAPPTPTALQSNYEWLKANRPDLADRYIQAQTTAPPLVIDNGNGTKTLYPAGTVPRVGSPSAPAVGTIDSGYRFMGGDPSDQKNWQPVGGGDPSLGGGAGLTTPRPFR